MLGGLIAPRALGRFDEIAAIAQVEFLAFDVVPEAFGRRCRRGGARAC